MELEDSNEEQGLRGLKTNIFNKISSSVQTSVTLTPTRLEQSEQPAIEQTIEQIAKPVVAYKIPRMQSHTPILLLLYFFLWMYGN